jgi:hypothetical protein
MDLEEAGPGIILIQRYSSGSGSDVRPLAYGTYVPFISTTGESKVFLPGGGRLLLGLASQKFHQLLRGTQ